VTVTDERKFAGMSADGVTIENSAGVLSVKDEAVTPGKLAASVAGEGLEGGAGTPLNVIGKVRGYISAPDSVYVVRPQVMLFRADAALTISRIHIHLTTTAQDIAGDLKFADNPASLAGATVIDVCDTTSGVFTGISGFNDATVPSGKYVYFQFDSSPHVDIDGIYFEVFYTYD
jgi:hypothetical protein